ncbi:MAG: hypothetical protein VZQ75_02685 [Candidatus Faecousia sp.]|nr:hypothetical protein [Candidatus Faecousia sp.]
MIRDSGERTLTELMNEIEQAIAQIGEDLGAEMIVHCSVMVGAKKEIGGKTFGDSVILPDILDEDEDEDWRTTLDRFKTRMKIYLESKQDEERRKDGG